MIWAGFAGLLLGFAACMVFVDLTDHGHVTPEAFVAVLGAFAFIGALVICTVTA